MSARRVAWGAALLAMLAATAGCSRRPSADEMRGWGLEIRRLEAEQDSLRTRTMELVGNDPRMQKIPQGDVVLVVPTVFLRSVIERVFDDVVDNVTLSLRGLKAHIAKSVKKVIPIGEFVLDIDIHEVRGRLGPGQPELRFGGDRVSMTLPVAVREGRGDATLHFVWDGKNVADLTCGDLDVTQRVTGMVIPATYTFTGGMDLQARGNQIVCTPDFPETNINLKVRPSQESWDAVNAILAEKHGVCGWVLDMVDVPALLGGMLEEKGFNVKIPMNNIPAFVIPAGVRDSVRVGGKVIMVETRTKTLRLDAEAIWYSADLTMRSR